MLISTTDFALIDELSQASSSVFSSPKHRHNIPSKINMLRYVDDSSVSQFSLDSNATIKKSINAEKQMEKMKLKEQLVFS